MSLQDVASCGNNRSGEHFMPPPLTQQLKNKDRNLRKRYGITLKQYNEMLKDQDYKCAICLKPHTKEAKGLQVDHCHVTGRVRGLLCCYCNRKVVGRIGDDYHRMKGFIKYIEKQLREDKDWPIMWEKRRVQNAKKKNK